MRHGLVVVSLLLLSGLVAGCSGSDNEAATSGTDQTETSGTVTLTAPSWAVPLLSKAGKEGAAVMASSDFAVGENRLTFLLVRDNGQLIRTPTADVYYRPDEGGSTKRVVARLVPIGVTGSGAQDDVKEIYVAKAEFPREGKQWVVIQPRGLAYQGFQIIDVKAKPTAVAVGDEAPSSNNPTVSTASAEKITTARPPDTELLRHSVADSLEAGAPYVLAFATPALCQSRTCGPTVEVVDAGRKRLASRGIRFIHLEIYEDNLPGNGVNRWVKEWKLPTEPWVYVVDRNGIVRDRFEGAVSVAELEASVRSNLLR